MNNFSFYSPTEFVFGKNVEEKTGAQLTKFGAKKVLIHYGMGSVIKSGLMKKITDSLEKEKISYVMLGGAQPNPISDLVYEGIELCRKENVDTILAVGGGSSIDSAKAIAAGAPYAGDFWDFYDGKATVKKALKVATVLTIPAAGSEGSGDTVITHTNGNLKRGYGSSHLRPIFSIMNPELTFTLPPYQTACGVVDMMAHVMERYFSNTSGVEISERLAEAVMLTVIKEAPVVLKDPTNYEARANLMWAGTVAHTGLVGLGRHEDWASHCIEHELSGLYDCAHGAGLAVIFPAWMKHVYNDNIDVFVQYAERIWNIKPSENKEETVLKSIAALESFYQSIGMPVTFEQIGAKKEDIPKLVEKLRINVGESLGSFKRLTMLDAERIYQLACQE